MHGRKGILNFQRIVHNKDSSIINIFVLLSFLVESMYHIKMLNISILFSIEIGPPLSVYMYHLLLDHFSVMLNDYCSSSTRSSRKS